MNYNQPEISVIVVCHHERRALVDLLNSLENSVFKNFEVILLFNGSINVYNDFKSNYKKYLFNLSTYYLGQSFGVSASRNEGALKANAPILFFTDPDVLLKAHSLSMVLGHFSQRQEVAVIGSYELPKDADSLFTKFKTTLNFYTHQNTGSSSNTFWTACGAIKKEIFLELKGFDESFFIPAIEDIELGYRLKNKNYFIYLDKNMLVRHCKQWTFYSLFKTDLFSRAIPWTKLLCQNKNKFFFDLNLNLNSRLSVVLSFLVPFLFFLQFYLLQLFLLFCIFYLNRGLIFLYYQTQGFLYTVFSFFVLFLYFLNAGFGYLLGVLLFYFAEIKSRVCLMGRLKRSA